MLISRITFLTALLLAVCSGTASASAADEYVYDAVHSLHAQDSAGFFPHVIQRFGKFYTTTFTTATC